MKVPIGGPFQTTPAMQANVMRVLNSGRLSPGPLVAKFEQAFGDYHGARAAIMTNSGTSALVVALQAMREYYGWQGTPEVIIPAITFVATVNAAIHAGFKPVLVDVDPATYAIDTDQIVNALTDQTRVIIPVHPFGLPAEMRAILAIARRHKLKVIEDACEALGATYGGEPVGALGDVGCFSFYMSHHITAGVGGMAITSDPRLGRLVRSLVNHGWDRAKAPMDTTEYDFEAIRTRYHFKSIGHSYRATEFEAAIALPQLDGLKAAIKRRVDNAKALTAGLKPFANRLQLPYCPYNRSHALMMYPVILKEGDKWELIAHLEAAGIDTREMLPLTNQPCYEGRFNEADYPVAKWINEQGFYVGCSQYLTEEQVEYTVSKFKEWLE